MNLSRLRRALASVAIASCGATALAIMPTTAHAAYVTWGNVLVPGSQWAGASASLGDLNVYSNGTGSQDHSGTYGLDFECVELAARWAELAFGDNHASWAIAYASQMWQAGPKLRVPFLQHPNGGADGPQFGDLIIFASTSFDPTGHVVVVSGTGAGYVDIVEQNWGNYAPTGRARLPIQGTYMPVRWGLPILGWLRSATAPNGWQGQEGPGGFTTDATGNVYPWGSAGFPSEGTLWPTAATARGVARIPKTNSGYVLDSAGWLHDFGGAPRLTPTATFTDTNIARAIRLTGDGLGGYVLDGYGLLHRFGDAQPVTAYTGTWPGWDIARDFVLLPDNVSGYVLDGYGGIHPFGSAPRVRVATGYSGGTDTARGLCLRTDQTSGWWVDGANDLHSFGGAPSVQSTADFPGQDMARGIVCGATDGGYTVTAWGRVREFGDAPPTVTATTFVSPVAAGIAL
jgi:hypothetical protein